MSSDERKNVMAHTREVVGSRAHLVAGCNAGSTREAIRLAEAAVGMDTTPSCSPPADVAADAARAGRPLPSRRRRRRQAGRALQLPGASRCRDRLRVPRRSCRSSQHHRHQGVQRRLLQVLAFATNATRATSQIMCGSDDQAADYFAWGVRSWLAGTANVLPHHHVVIMNTANEGNYGLARRQFAAILPWIQNMESGSYNAKAKLGLAHQGIDCGPVRAPLLASPTTSPPSSSACSTRRSPRRSPRAERYVRSTRSYTAVEVHAEGEQGTCYLGSVFDVPGAIDARQVAAHQRGRRLDPQVPVLRAARSPADQRQPGLPVARSRRPMPGSSSARPIAPTR